MASAGVVGMAEVVTPNSNVSNPGFTGSPAMWAFIWVGASAALLLFIHMAVAGRGGR